MEKTSIVKSACWAAYGDALGFMTELGDESTVKWRTGQSYVYKLQKWRRQIGGRSGVITQLPVGCYSDDTQLRLATGRAIKSDGYFDVEAFAKVELPVWLSYALGAGSGTKASVDNLTRGDVNWFSNFFSRRGIDYFKVGGNGGAMRIQPHVWKGVYNSNKSEIFIDVVRNVITTHGHPRAVYGALFHAAVLEFVLREGKVPAPTECIEIIEDIKKTPKLVSKDPDLASFWLPAWESQGKTDFSKATDEVVEELRECIIEARKILENPEGSSEKCYRCLMEKLGGFDKESRGSGVITTVMAWFMALFWQEEGASKCIQIVGNTLGSDTDTIGSMLGALIGPLAEDLPPEEVMDQVYIESQAYYLASVGDDANCRDFSYPDLSKWRPPKYQVDSLFSYEQNLIVAGLGFAEPSSEVLKARGSDRYSFQWLKLEIGQTIFIKRRSQLAEYQSLPDVLSAQSIYNDSFMDFNKEKDGLVYGDQMARSSIAKNRKLVESGRDTLNERNGETPSKSIDELTTEAIKSGFDESVIGKHITYLLGEREKIEDVVAYTSIIAKAWLARKNKRRG